MAVGVGVALGVGVGVGGAGGAGGAGGGVGPEGGGAPGGVVGVVVAGVVVTMTAVEVGGGVAVIVGVGVGICFWQASADSVGTTVGRSRAVMKRPRSFVSPAISNCRVGMSLPLASWSGGLDALYVELDSICGGTLLLADRIGVVCAYVEVPDLAELASGLGPGVPPGVFGAGVVYVADPGLDLEALSDLRICAYEDASRKGMRVLRGSLNRRIPQENGQGH